jgi:U6 snRNA-associated Sm-like protein LSm6
VHPDIQLLSLIVRSTTFTHTPRLIAMSTNGDSPAADVAGDSRDPSGFLSEIIGAPVTVKLNSGIIYKGMHVLTARFTRLTFPGDLQSVDGYMNIALERCQEVTGGRVIRSWGDAFVRGNNGMFAPDSNYAATLTCP